MRLRSSPFFVSLVSPCLPLSPVFWLLNFFPDLYRDSEVGALSGCQWPHAHPDPALCWQRAGEGSLSSTRSLINSEPSTILCPGGTGLPRIPIRCVSACVSVSFSCSCSCPGGTGVSACGCSCASVKRRPSRCSRGSMSRASSVSVCRAPAPIFTPNPFRGLHRGVRRPAPIPISGLPSFTWVLVEWQLDDLVQSVAALERSGSGRGAHAKVDSEV
jgi:hypothetical protein